MTAPIIVLQHQDDAPAGLLADPLDRSGASWRVVRVDRGEPLPEPERLAAVVSLGASDSAGSKSISWVRAEIDWLGHADRAGVPILGLCFGAQALAVALGGSVSRAERREWGWIEVRTREPELIAAGPWITWHDDVIALPPDASLLAENEWGPQAYRVRGHLGVQFHPEVTPEIVDDWAREDRVPTPRGVELFASAAANAQRLFEGFLEPALSRARSR